MTDIVGGAVRQDEQPFLPVRQAGPPEEQDPEVAVAVVVGCTADVITVMVPGEAHPRIIPRSEIAERLEFAD